MCSTAFITLKELKKWCQIRRLARWRDSERCLVWLSSRVRSDRDLGVDAGCRIDNRKEFESDFCSLSTRHLQSLTVSISNRNSHAANKWSLFSRSSSIANYCSQPLPNRHLPPPTLPSTVASSNSPFKRWTQAITLPPRSITALSQTATIPISSCIFAKAKAPTLGPRRTNHSKRR